jgi:hypothetical protein
MTKRHGLADVMLGVLLFVSLWQLGYCHDILQELS